MKGAPRGAAFRLPRSSASDSVIATKLQARGSEQAPTAWAGRRYASSMTTENEREADQATRRLEAAEGAHVFAVDGNELGTLAEVREGYFKVEVSMAPDYWLPFDSVARNEGSDLYLSLDRDEVEGRKVDNAAMDLEPGELPAALEAERIDTARERRFEGDPNYGLHPRPRV